MGLRHLVGVLLLLQVSLAQPSDFEAACDNIGIEFTEIVTGSVSTTVVEVVVPQTSCDYFGSGSSFSAGATYVLEGEEYKVNAREEIASGAGGTPDCGIVKGTKFSPQPVIFRREFPNADYVVVKSVIYSPSNEKECVVEKSYGNGQAVDSHTVNEISTEEFYNYCDSIELGAELIYSEEQGMWYISYNFRIPNSACNYFGVGSSISVSVEGEEKEQFLVNNCPYLPQESHFMTGLTSGELGLELDPLEYGLECIRTIHFQRPAQTPAERVRCNQTFRGDPECFGLFPGTELNGFLCNSSCQLSNQSLELEVEFRTCITNTISECMEQEPIQNLTLDYRVPLLVSFNVPLTERLEQCPPTINVTVNGELQASQKSDSGILLFRYMDAGKHNFTILVSHNDYFDLEYSRDIFVKPGLAGEVSVELYPGEVKLLSGTPLALNLKINNSLNFPQNFTMSSNLNATFEPSIYLDSYETKTYTVNLPPFEEEGSFILNLTIKSPEISLNALSYIKVEGEKIYNATISAESTEAGVRAAIKNTGTVWDNYTLSTCNGNTTLTLDSGASQTFLVGFFDSPCEICLYSDYFFKCIKITPVTLTVAIPSLIEAELNKKTEIKFQTSSVAEGTILVEVDSQWINDFECSTNCNKTLEFIPDKPGEFTIEFRIIFPEAGLEGTARTKVVVVQGFSVDEDRKEIESKLMQVENKLLLLENRGISSPAAEQILLQVKEAEPKTPEEVAGILGELERAEKYIKYASDVKMPRQRGFPVSQVLVGFSAIMVGVSVLYMVLHYQSNPYHPIYQRMGLSPKQYFGRAEKFIKNEFKDAELPKLR